ncbi:MAG: hypothetical protein ABI434_19390, partial [Burkholderiaceae bacterium]
GQFLPFTAVSFQAAQRTSIATVWAAFFSAIALLSLVTSGVESRTLAGGPRAGCSGKVFDWLVPGPSRRVRQRTDSHSLWHLD